MNMNLKVRVTRYQKEIKFSQKSYRIKLVMEYLQENGFISELV